MTLPLLARSLDGRRLVSDTATDMQFTCLATAGNLSSQAFPLGRGIIPAARRRIRYARSLHLRFIESFSLLSLKFFLEKMLLQPSVPYVPCVSYAITVSCAAWRKCLVQHAAVPHHMSVAAQVLYTGLIQFDVDELNVRRCTFESLDGCLFAREITFLDCQSYGLVWNRGTSNHRSTDHAHLRTGRPDLRHMHAY